MKARILKISDTLLHHLLKLPDDTEVTGLSHHLYFTQGAYALRVVSDSFPDVPDGHKIPEAEAVYNVTGGKREFAGWCLDGTLKPDEAIVPTPPKRGREFI